MFSTRDTFACKAANYDTDNARSGVREMSSSTTVGGVDTLD
jgi:hypothetical protein